MRKTTAQKRSKLARVLAFLLSFALCVLPAQTAALAEGEVEGEVEGAMLPDAVPDITGVKLVDVQIGTYHGLALDENGEVWAWGDNSHGQWGMGFTGNAPAYTYVKVLGLDDVVQIGAGSYVSYALKADGTVWAWGYNYYGQLGDGTTTDRSLPVQVKNLDGVVELSAGVAGHYCAVVKADGTVWCWGQGFFGTLGNGTTVDAPTPVQAIISDVVQISISGLHTIALRGDGTVWAWGYGSPGNMGNGSTTQKNPTPQRVSQLLEIEDISAGTNHSMARKADGTLWLWGQNTYGEIGNGTQTDTLTPVQLQLTGIESIQAGRYQSLVRREDGSVLGWGNNQYGQLGTADVPVKQTTPVDLEHFSGAVHLFRSDYTTAYAKKDGSIWGCGRNQVGQLKPDHAYEDIYEPILLFGPGTYVGPGSGVDPVDPPDPAEHTVTVVERYADGSPDVVNTYNVADGAAFSQAYGSAGLIQSLDVSAADAQVTADFTARTLDIAKVDRDITVTLVFDAAGTVVTGDHTVAVTETWADGSQPDRTTTKQVDNGQGFYQIFPVPAGYTGSLSATGGTVNYNAAGGAVHIAAVTGDVDITITYTPEGGGTAAALPDSGGERQEPEPAVEPDVKAVSEPDPEPEDEATEGED